MAQHIICIGSSAASLSCATYVRRLDKTCRITMLTSQQELPYNTCLLVDYVAKKRERSSLFLPFPDKVESIYNESVITIDKQLKTIGTVHGNEYTYDKLFIGIGLKPRLPAWAEPYLYTKVFPFKTLYDIDLFNACALPVGHVLVVGGGLTGIELCEALVVRGYRVTLIEKSSRLMPAFQEHVSLEIYQLLIRHGVTLYLNSEASEDDINRFDVIFLATGGIPTTDFLQGQIELDNGFIVVDNVQRTSDYPIFAGGDCVLGRRLWPQAIRDGAIAAYEMLNVPAPLLKIIHYKTTINIFGNFFTL